MQDIDFDLAGAKKAGAKPAQLSSYFKSNFNIDFDFDGAYKAGATDNQILSYLNQSYADLKKKGNSGIESGVKSSPTPSKYTLKEEAPKKQYYSSKLEKGLIFDKEGQLYEPSSEALTKAIAPPAEDLNLKKSTQKDLVEQSRIPEEKPIKPVEEQGLLLNLVSALDKGFAKNYIGSPVKALGTALQGGTKKALGGTGEGFVSDALIKFGDYFNNAIDELTPQDEAFKNTLWDQFGQAFGQVASLIATGGMTGALGKAGQAAEIAAQIAPKGAAAATALKTFGSELSAPTAISAGLSMGQAEFDRAKQAGATDDQAFEVFYKNAAVGSVLETIPVMQFFKRFEKATAGGVANYLKTKGAAGLTGGIEEMTTEVLQQLYSNKTAKDIYNINQDIFDGVGSSGGVGFGVGFLLNAMGANAKILRKQGKIGDAKSIENQIKQFETKLENPASIKVLSTQIANQGSGQNVIANLNQDLANNVITPQEHQEGVNFAQKADAVAPKVPENISPDNKAKSIELLVERNDIKENNEILLQQKQASDEAYHAGINEQIKVNDEKIKKINDEVFKIAKEPIVEEVEQPIVEEPVEFVEKQAVVEKPKLADKLSTFKEKYTLISEGAAKAIETKKINQQAGKIVPMNTEAAVLAWLSGNNELSWKAINDAAGRKEQARLNVGKDYSTEEVKLRDYAAKKRNGGVGLRDAAHQIWQDLTKRTGDKNITTRDIEGALLNAIRENPTRIDAAKNLISIAGAEEAPISIEEGVEDFYSRKGEQPTEPVVEQGMPEGGFVPFQEGEEEIPFSVQEIPTDEVNDMKEIVKDLVEEGLNLNAIRNRIAKELGYDSKRLKETVNKAYQEYTKEFTPKEVTTGIIGRGGNFISDLFGGKAEDKVVILKDAQSIFAKAEQMAETGGRVEFQATMPNGEKVTAKPVDASVVNGFYSPLELQINQMKADKMPAKQWLDKLKGEEAKWTGLVDWLSQQEVSLTKENIKNWLQDNQIEINEIVKGNKETADIYNRKKWNFKAFGDGIWDFDFEKTGGGLSGLRIDASSATDYASLFVLTNEGDYKEIGIFGPYEDRSEILDGVLEDGYFDSYAEGQGGLVKYGNYVLDGEKSDYKEILITYPSTPNVSFEKWNENKKSWGQSEGTLEEYKKAGKLFKSDHFDEKNILVHVRADIRTDSKGNKIYFIEEVQSDWGQEGKKRGFFEDVTLKEIERHDNLKNVIGVLDDEYNKILHATFYADKIDTLLVSDFLALPVGQKRNKIEKTHEDFQNGKDKYINFLQKEINRKNEIIRDNIDRQNILEKEEYQLERFLDTVKSNREFNQANERLSELDKEIKKLNREAVALEEENIIDSGMITKINNEKRNDDIDYNKAILSVESTFDIDEYNKIGKEFRELDNKIISIKTHKGPFVTKTNDWAKLGLKVALKQAVKQGADKIAWSTGEQQVGRYENNLRKQVDKIETKRDDELDTVEVIAYKNGNIVFNNTLPTYGSKNISGKDVRLEDVVGKELAQKIKSGGKDQSFEGNQLTIGGKGMIGFYGSTANDNFGILGDLAKSLYKQIPEKISLNIKEAKLKELQKELDEHTANKTSDFKTRDFHLEQAALAKTMNDSEKEEGNKKEAEYYEQRAITSAKYEESVLRDIKRLSVEYQHSVNITPELKAQVEVGLPLFMANPEGDILGFKFQDKIYLNGEKLNPNTPIHEAGHIWTEWVKQNDNKVYQRGIELVKNSDYLKEVKSSKFYQEQAKKLATKEEAELYFQHEALAMAIGDKGAQFVTESKRTSFKEWLDALWTKIKDLAGFKDITAEELQNLTFEEFTKMAVKDILGKQFEGRTLQEIYEILPMGKKLRQNKEEILIRDNFDNIVAELIKNNKIEKIC